MTRLKTQTKVNFFNPWITCVLDSNIDIQLVPDVYACAAYVVEYVNKAKRGMSNLHQDIQKTIEESPDTQMTYRKALRQMNLKMLNAVEISAQEAAWFLL
ncbi:hypothetical protein HPB49_013745 [Dermacentor silvarum]|uniref:Uncharacterized protein n=1 Tax=Dermacentor silvarum TaxID=543639 RepID=A0ACB8E0J4_DERSI|nr:hypothetical protein HPB49_013745 [Dermacentor silvarum]